MPINIDELIASGYEARRQGKLAEAKQLFEQALDSCDDGKSENYARALTALGQIERDLENTPAALYHYIRAANIYGKLPDVLRRAHSLRHVGDILRESCDFLMALSYYDEALTIYRTQPGRKDLDLANLLRGFALLKETLNDTQNAKKLWEEAKQLYQAAGVEAGVRESQKHLQQQ
jgi:tetratricopeptide (TPR) repeat protein